MKYLLKQAAIVGGLEAISRLRLARLFPDASGRGAIFTLHHVRPHQPRDFEPNGHLEVTPDYLAAVIEESLAAGLVPVPLADLPARLADADDHRRFVCFTLDDGYRNNAEYAAPVFRRYGVPYTIFITPGFVERSTTLWWETAAVLFQQHDRFQLDFGTGEETVVAPNRMEKRAVFRRLCMVMNAGEQDRLIDNINRAAAAKGISAEGIVDSLLMNEAEVRALARDPLASFGGHTLTHPPLARVSAERLAREIEGSITQVSAYAGAPVTSFAYPYGTSCAAGEREFKAAAAAGLRIAVTTRPGVIRPQSLEQPMAFRRISLNGLYQQRRYVKALISGLPFKVKS